MISSVRSSVENVRRGNATLSLSNLQALDQLRGQLEDLEKNDSLSLHWGLYTGDTLYASARKVYFERLKDLSLDRLNQAIASKLTQAGVSNPAGSATPIYDRLKTHRTMTALACTVDGPLISRVLQESTADAHPGLEYQQLALLRSQFDYYASQLGKKGELPVSLPEDPVAEANARTFLRRAGGLEQQLRALLSEVSQQSKPLQVADYADDYRSVLTGPAEVSGAFTKKGQALFEDRIARVILAAAARPASQGIPAAWPNKARTSRLKTASARCTTGSTQIRGGPLSGPTTSFDMPDPMMRRGS